MSSVKRGWQIFGPAPSFRADLPGWPHAPTRRPLCGRRLADTKRKTGATPLWHCSSKLASHTPQTDVTEWVQALKGGKFTG